MDWMPIITGLGATIVSIGGFIITWRRFSLDRQTGVSTDERETRRDTVADRDALIDQLQEDMRELRSRMSQIEREYETERTWNRQLVDHIYRGNPPPPPPRPVHA